MSRTHKGAQKEIRSRNARMDHDTKSDIRYKVLTGYYFEDEMNDRR